MAWRFRGQLHVTAIVKATFAFAHDAAMVRAAPQEILRADIHHGNNPGRSIRFTSDIAPYLPRADVLFTGHAYAPPERAVTQRMTARIGIFRGAQPVLDKSLLIQAKEGFQSLPIVYDRAFGGIGSRDNPLGVGLNPGTAEPNVLDPVDPRRVAGFGPVGCWMPARKRLLGSTPPRALQREIADIPDDFDWSYFQSAPPDQQVDALHGDEWIVLAGLHARVPCLRMRLPWIAGLARIHGLGGSSPAEGAPLSLRADTLRIDGDEQRCTVVWRGSFPVPNEAALAAAHVVAGVQVGDAPIAWPAPLTGRPSSMPAATEPQPASRPEASALPGGDMTMGMTDPPLLMSALPFRPGSSLLFAPSPRGAARTPPEHALAGTLPLTLDAERAQAPGSDLPFLDAGEHHAEAAPAEAPFPPVALPDPPPAAPPDAAPPAAAPPVQIVEEASISSAPPLDPAPPSPPSPPPWRWAPPAAPDEPTRAPGPPPRAPRQPGVDVQRLLYPSKGKRS
ncbi:DUF2169 family type VI secretion system accessory protein [Sorangium sp. So ce124]|uniref:DUF2169 family type VI secretion system accessory protein n=1 Tax=Sorangium sp. So ce124 TaxID=3133280 RepID=UPI003F6180E3